jgi:hypothetical protein
MADLDHLHFDGAGEQIVGQGAGEGLASIVTGDPSQRTVPMPCTTPPRIWPSTSIGFDHRAAVLGDRKVEKLDRACLGINGYNGTMCRVGIDPGANCRLVARSHIEQRVDARR